MRQEKTFLASHERKAISRARLHSLALLLCLHHAVSSSHGHGSTTPALPVTTMDDRMTSSTTMRLALVLGSVGGTLTFVLLVFVVVKLIQKHRIRHVRASKRNDIEKRRLTRRSSVTDSFSSGYSSEGPVVNGRRVSRRGVVSLSEFAMTSFSGPGNDWLGVYNPMFSADFDLPGHVKRIERDQIALLRKLKDVTYGKVRS